MFVYYNESILNYISSIRKYFNLSSEYAENLKLSNLLKGKKPKQVFLFLIDGMGANLIEKKLPEDAFLRKYMLGKTSTVFPPTTTAATTAIRNGKAPNQNAWLGWMQYLKEVNDVIIPFKGKAFYNDNEYGYDLMRKAIPVKTTEEELLEKGYNTRIVFPSFEEDGFEDLDSMCQYLQYISHKGEYQYIYAYWDKYDSYMHKYGPSDKLCDNYLEHINYEMEYLAQNLAKDTMLIVIADHGQVDIKQDYNLYGSKYAKYFRLAPSIEPRAMAFFIKDEFKEIFEKEFKQEFEDRFILLSHQQVLDTKLFGDKKNHPRFEEFIGDYLAIGKANTTFSYCKKEKNYFKGQHAGCLEDELLVPIIVYQK